DVGGDLPQPYRIGEGHLIDDGHLPAAVRDGVKPVDHDIASLHVDALEVTGRWVLPATEGAALYDCAAATQGGEHDEPACHDAEPVHHASSGTSRSRCGRDQHCDRVSQSKAPSVLSISTKANAVSPAPVSTSKIRSTTNSSRASRSRRAA